MSWMIYKSIMHFINKIGVQLRSIIHISALIIVLFAVCIIMLLLKIYAISFLGFILFLYLCKRWSNILDDEVVVHSVLKVGGKISKEKLKTLFKGRTVGKHIDKTIERLVKDKIVLKNGDLYVVKNNSYSFSVPAFKEKK
jgi:hypothetical protein